MYEAWLAQGFWMEICLLWPTICELAKRGGNFRLEMEMVHQLAIVKHNRGEVRAAQALYESILHAPPFNDLCPNQRASYLHQAAICYLFQGQYTQAESLLQQALRLRGNSTAAFDILPPLWAIQAYSLKQLGNIAAFRGNFTRANRYFEQSLALFQEHGEAENLACVAYESLGHIRMLYQDYDEAIYLLEKELAIRRRRQEELAAAEAAIDLAAAYIGQGRLSAAERLLTDGLSTCRKLHSLREVAKGHLHFGYLEARRGNHIAAVEQWRQGLEQLKTLPTPALEFKLLTALLVQFCQQRRLGALLTTVRRLRANVRAQRLGPLAVWRLLSVHAALARSPV